MANWNSWLTSLRPTISGQTGRNGPAISRGGSSAPGRGYASGEVMMSQDMPAAPNPLNYRPDVIELYGVPLNVTELGMAAKIPFEGHHLRLAVVPVEIGPTTLDPINNKIAVIAAVYGYAFEGFCYRFDSPRIFIFEPTITEEGANGCGFDEKDGYAMWQILRSTAIIDASVNIDTAEQIVLNANLPGNKNPNTYGNSIIGAHKAK
jgi:hypothetical protein